MKKFITIILSIIIMTSTTAFSAEIPIETYPENATEESAAIVENLIGGILDEVQNGLGYQMASGRANTIIRKAVIDKQTNGYGYGILSPIAQNAIRYYRDMYLRPDYYAETENTVKALIADLIIEVKNGADYETVKEKAYTRIYQSANPSYNPEVDRTGDFCYWDIPPVDSVMLMQARKLLKNAIK
ncbi:MAG: hypothetical protein HFE51_10595 [Clostridia bacterium]|nr:hypothetical protein [Clostridia bacterium]